MHVYSDNNHAIHVLTLDIFTLDTFCNREIYYSTTKSISLNIACIHARIIVLTGLSHAVVVDTQKF